MFSHYSIRAVEDLEQNISWVGGGVHLDKNPADVQFRVTAKSR